MPPALRINGRLLVLVLKTGFSSSLLVSRPPAIFCFDGRRGVREPPDQRAAGNLDDEIFAGVAVHALAHAVFAVLRDEARDVILLR